MEIRSGLSNQKEKKMRNFVKVYTYKDLVFYEITGDLTLPCLNVDGVYVSTKFEKWDYLKLMDEIMAMVTMFHCEDISSYLILFNQKDYDDLFAVALIYKGTNSVRNKIREYNDEERSAVQWIMDYLSKNNPLAVKKSLATTTTTTSCEKEVVVHIDWNTDGLLLELVKRLLSLTDNNKIRKLKHY